MKTFLEILSVCVIGAAIFLPLYVARRKKRVTRYQETPRPYGALMLKKNKARK